MPALVNLETLIIREQTYTALEADPLAHFATHTLSSLTSLRLLSIQAAKNTFLDTMPLIAVASRTLTRLHTLQVPSPSPLQMTALLTSLKPMSLRAQKEKSTYSVTLTGLEEAHTSSLITQLTPLMISSRFESPKGTNPFLRKRVKFWFNMRKMYIIINIIIIINIRKTHVQHIKHIVPHQLIAFRKRT